MLAEVIWISDFACLASSEIVYEDDAVISCFLQVDEC